ncbi:hypothetical protein [Niastella vici]|uniref:hypothetical protein n=1 Tax=Niastella vici TaxID=1703345 RepID=UPI001301A738|nr:hypothetical protein [Niastella vici]
MNQVSFLAKQTEDAYNWTNITADTKAQTFVMKILDEKDCNYEYIKRLLKK